MLYINHNRSNTLDPYWLGPVTIVEVIDPVTYRLEGIMNPVNVAHLKEFQKNQLPSDVIDDLQIPKNRTVYTPTPIRTPIINVKTPKEPIPIQWSPINSPTKLNSPELNPPDKEPSPNDTPNPISNPDTETRSISY